MTNLLNIILDFKYLVSLLFILITQNYTKTELETVNAENTTSGTTEEIFLVKNNTERAIPIVANIIVKDPVIIFNNLFLSFFIFPPLQTCFYESIKNWV